MSAKTSERYSLTAPQLQSATVNLNGQELHLGANNEMPELDGRPTPSGTIELEPASITFFAISDAGNHNCQ